MKLTRTYLKYAWPFWLVQFGTLAISTGPRNMYEWLAFAAVFNGACIWLAAKKFLHDRDCEFCAPIPYEIVEKEND